MAAVLARERATAYKKSHISTLRNAMILSCPACSTRYLIDPALLGPDGRVVRCAKCAHQWVGKPQSEPVAAPEDDVVAFTRKPRAPAPEPAPNYGPEPEPEPEPEAVPTRGKLPALAKPHAGHGRTIVWSLLVLLIGVFAGGIFARDSVMEIWPSTARLYERLGLSQPSYESVLSVRNAKSSYQAEDGKQVLVVQGEVLNISTTLQTVPKLRASLRENGRDVQTEIFQAAQSRLLPGEVASFVTRFKEPSPSATELTITFTDKP